MKSRSGFIITLTMVIMLVSMLASVPITVQAKKVAPQVSPVKLFDAIKGEFPEGLAFDRAGNMYVSVSSLGQIWKIKPDGSEKLLLTIPPDGGSMAFGLAVDDSGNVYATFAFNPETQGVYRIDHKSGIAQRIPGTENILWANGLTFDNRGNLYVTDSWTGAIWRITPKGSAKIWLQHDLLEGLGQIPGFPPVGANGIAYYHDSLYVANTEKGLLVRVPIMKGGVSGKPVVVVDGSELYGLDGIALDVHGNVYGALVLQNELVKIDHENKKITVLATPNDGLDMPASPAFGTGKCNQQTLFFTNFALLGTNPTGYGPAVLKIWIGTPGLPLP
jgi:sugar lactone lactonase YvrE